MASGAASPLNDMVDAWELELDHREAIVSFREERVLQLEQRLLELQEIERVYTQQSTATKPSKPRRVRKKKRRTEAQEKTLDAIRALHSAEDAVGGEALGEACRLLEASCTKSAASAYMVVAGVAESCEEETPFQCENCGARSAGRAGHAMLLPSGSRRQTLLPGNRRTSVRSTVAQGTTGSSPHVLP